MLDEYGHESPEGIEPPFRYLLKRAWVPVLSFALIAALQNIDIVFVKHQASDSAAGSYAAASVAEATGLPRRQVYARALKRGQEGRGSG